MAPPWKPTFHVPRPRGRPLVGERITLEGDKVCGDCGVLKPKSEFHRKTENPSGVQAYCKVCQIERATAGRDPVLAANYQVGYYATNREAIRSQRRYHYQHSEQVRERKRIYMLAYRARRRAHKEMIDDQQGEGTEKADRGCP